MRSLVVLLCLVPLVLGHGRLMQPAGRASLWRKGFSGPPNYDDDGMNCGGYGTQWEKCDGKCGVCGESCFGPFDHEAGGRYANGVITGTYQKAGVMEIEMNITTNHKGWNEFRLCPVDDKTVKATDECLDRYLLPLADGSGTTRWWFPSAENGMWKVKVQLPADLTCSQCVLQWKWHCANSWGCDADGQCYVGGGPQEQFYGCADISIF